MNKSVYLSNKQLNEAVGGVNYSAPANLYFSLYTSAPTASGGGTEVSGGGYARKLVANNTTNFSTAAAGSVTTLNDITWAPATSSWGTVTAVGVHDASTGGNLLYFTTLNTQRTVGAESAFSFPAGSLVWTES